MMKSHFNRIPLVTLALAGAVSMGTYNVANAALLDLPALEFPLATFDNTGTTTYDPADGIIVTDALPISAVFAAGTRPRTITPTSLGESVSINVQVDTSGNLIGGVPGDDLIIIGEIDTDGDGNIDYSGVLLTGEVVEFGFLDSGTNDRYNYIFAVTGGELASLYPTNAIGIDVVSELSNFTDFTTAFQGRSKATLGATPEIPQEVTECKIDVLGTCTVQVPPAQPSCDAKIAASTFKYTGPTLNGATVEFIGKDSGYASYTTDLISGETILTSPEQNGYTVDGRPGDLGSKLSVYINGEEEILHTSCSVPFTVGQPAPLNGGGSKGSDDKGSKGSDDKGSKDSKDKGSKGSKDKGSKGSDDKGSKGSKDKGSKGSSDKGSKGSHDKGSSDSSNSDSVSSNWTVVAFVDKEGDVVETTTQSGLTCSIPANSTNPVVFGFELTNSGNSVIDTTDVLDIFGVVPGSPVGTLNPGESVKLERSELISVETENVVSVTGNAGPVTCNNLTAITIHVEEEPYCPPTKGSDDKGSKDKGSKGSKDKGSKGSKKKK